MRYCIAIIPSSGLGDGLLWAIFAYNMHRNGYDIVLYNNFLYELRGWFKWLNIQNEPPLSEREAYLKEYDLVIAEAFSFAGIPAANESYRMLSEKYCFMRMGYFNDDPSFDHRAVKIHDKSLHVFEGLSGLFIPTVVPGESMASNIADICKTVMDFKDPTKSNGISVPHLYSFRVNKKRVIIHPFASASKKEWPIKKYVALAKKLSKEGWDIKIVYSSKEIHSVAKYISKYGPYFYHTETLDELAAYLYESAYFIGNDSGPGHLASNLGIPVLTLVIKNVSVWRADWALTKLVKGYLYNVFRSKKIRKITLTVNKAKKEFYELVALHEKDKRGSSG